MKCDGCQQELAYEETITAIQGTLLCNRCAKEQYSTYMLYAYGEEVVPSDIGIFIEHDDTVEDYEYSFICQPDIKKQFRRKESI